MHTPGPWRLDMWSYEGGKRIVPTIQTDRDAVATALDLWPPDDRKAERDANGRLIALAPELLQVLTTILEVWGEHKIIGPMTYQDARALIDKAK